MSTYIYIEFDNWLYIHFFGLRRDLDTKVTNLLIVTFVTMATKVTSYQYSLFAMITRTQHSA
jgi:hypothetical protein